jgi:hypothetical protein
MLGINLKTFFFDQLVNNNVQLRLQQIFFY